MLAYDPYRQRRKPDCARALDATAISTLAEDLKLKLGRGYKGHEHLERTGCVHMNRRVYASNLGRLLSPDPVFSAAAFSRSWNIYGYIGNSPMRFTDPTGLCQQPVNICPPSICPWNAGAGGAGGFNRASRSVTPTLAEICFEDFVSYVPTFGHCGGELSFVFFYDKDTLDIDRTVQFGEASEVPSTNRRR